MIIKTSLQLNLFSFNKANIEGGAIKWSQNMPNIIDNKYENNQAQYGSEIAAFPLRLIVNIHNETTFTDIDNNSSLLFDGSDNKTILLENISSGNSFPYVIVAKTLDIYGNIVKLDHA